MSDLNNMFSGEDNLNYNVPQSGSLSTDYGIAGGTLASDSSTSTPVSTTDTNTGNDPNGWNSANTKELISGLGVAQNATAQTIAGVEKNNETDSAKTEAQQLAGQNRIDVLNQSNIDIALRKKQLQIDETAFTQQQTKQSLDLKFSRFETALNMAAKKQQKFATTAQNFFSDYKSNQELHDMMDKILGNF